MYRIPPPYGEIIASDDGVFFKVKKEKMKTITMYLEKYMNPPSLVFPSDVFKCVSTLLKETQQMAPQHHNNEIFRKHTNL